MIKNGNPSEVQKKILKSLKSGEKIKYVRYGSRGGPIGKIESYTLTATGAKVAERTVISMWKKGLIRQINVGKDKKFAGEFTCDFVINK